LPKRFLSVFLSFINFSCIFCEQRLEETQQVSYVARFADLATHRIVRTFAACRRDRCRDRSADFRRLRANFFSGALLCVAPGALPALVMASRSSEPMLA
jgi:hypothetical protein